MAQDTFRVYFEDGEAGLYSAGGLLVLRLPHDIYTYLENQTATLSKQIFHDLLQIALLQEYGSARQMRTAFEIARQNSATDHYGLMSLQESLGQKTTYGIGR